MLARHAPWAQPPPNRHARRWEAHQRQPFRGVDPARSLLTVRLWDDRGGSTLLRKGRQLVGEGTVHAGHVKVRWVWVGTWGGWA